jgi:hypothetical protein
MGRLSAATQRLERAQWVDRPAVCYGLDGPGPLQSTLSRVLWELASAAAWNELSEAKLRAWLDELTDEAA